MVRKKKTPESHEAHIQNVHDKWTKRMQAKLEQEQVTELKVEIPYVLVERFGSRHILYRQDGTFESRETKKSLRKKPQEV